MTVTHDPTADPRPDLGGSELWLRLLAAAVDEDGDGPRSLVGWLRCMRCLGSELQAKADGRVTMRAPADVDADACLAELGDKRAIMRRVLAVVSEAWTCPSCGSTSTGGACRHCRAPRVA